MAEFNRALTQLVLEHDELVELAQVATGVLDVDEVSAELARAGMIDGGAVDPLAGSLAHVAIAPWRATVLERFDGLAMRPLFVGWHHDGRATLSEPNAEGHVVVTGTQLRLLPALVTQWLSLRPRPDPAGRRPIVTTTEILDRHIHAAGGADSTGDPDLDLLISHWRLAWRANGGWGAQRPDCRLTVVDAARLGVWIADHAERVGEENLEVTLVPATIKQALDRLGDVITGRTSPAPMEAERA
jgi:hypothetical protein